MAQYKPGSETLSLTLAKDIEVEIGESYLEDRLNDIDKVFSGLFRKSNHENNIYP